MVLFLIAVVLAALGVGADAYVDGGVHDIVLRNYRIAAVPDWMPVAAVASLILFLFLLHAIYTSIRIGMLRRASRQTGRSAAQRTALPIIR